MTFIADIIQSVFRPSLAALAISVAIAIVSIENSPYTVENTKVNLNELGCSGLLHPVCNFVKLF